MTGPMRAFVALEVPAAVRATLADGIARLRAELPRARWVRPEGVHLTLKFLGESDPGTLEELARGLRASLAGAGAVGVELGGAGFFPNPARARVAWIGGAAAGAPELAATIDRAATRLGWDRERRPWSLHLTLARLDRPWPRFASERFLEWGRALRPEPFTCPDAVLLSSRLQPGGAVYTELARIPLQ